MRDAASAAPLNLRVFGMRRSGNHAVIDWLRRNMPGEVVFLNDCGPGDPFRTYAMMETPRGDRHGPSFRATRWFPQFDEGREARSHIVSYEDMAPDAAGPPEGWPDPLRAPFRTVVIHRSFLNWLASFHALVLDRNRGTRWGVREPGEVAPFVALYAGLLGARCDLSICFDRWLGSASYRRGAVRALGLVPRDDGTGEASPYGGGSSFDGGCPSDRWRGMVEADGFETLAREAGRDPAFLARLANIYPRDAAVLARLATGGTLKDER